MTTYLMSKVVPDGFNGGKVLLHFLRLPEVNPVFEASIIAVVQGGGGYFHVPDSVYHRYYEAF